ncbi:MAG: glycerol-3-phosphate acyltransferase [Candidatus Borkfalkiaceae bacterium]|nr:glycerol-3-phosphate acyltransferase [Clostridia bacterium]MDY6223706.1 glycerol-3-phosphate acyltransferase [Christensenellaceae bacterium]
MTEWSFSRNWYQLLIVAAVCYFVGCFNFARFISKRKHRDITKIGSGNPGTMNMSREFGWKIGVITFFCDAFKGGIPTLIVHFIYRNYFFSGSDICVSDAARYLAALFVVIGHIFPVTNRFKGGKGIASTLGAFWLGLACENPWFLLLGFGFFVLIALYIFVTEWGSMGSLIGTAGFALWQGIIYVLRYGAQNNACFAAVLLILFIINAFTWGAHRKNIWRLLSGTEHKTSVRKIAGKG